MTTSRLTMGRRRLLKQLGLATAASAAVFRPGIGARAQQDIPQRLIGMWHANGWRVAPRDDVAYRPGAPEHLRADDDLFFPGRRRDASYELSTISDPWPEVVEPLGRHADDLVFIDGLFNKANRGQNGHTCGGLTFLTGTEPIQGYGSAGGISLDRVLAARNTTRFASLDLGVGRRTVPAQMSNSGPAQPNAAQVDPIVAYQRTFESLVPGNNAEARRAELAILRRRRQSLLDYSSSEITALRPYIPSADRPRLDAHAEAIRSMERRLDAAVSTSAWCAAPTAPAGLDPDNDADTPAISAVMLDMIAAAFACDLTRASTMHYGNSTGSYAPVWLGSNDQLHAMSHYASDDPRQSDYTAALRWVSGEVASLLDRLANIPEADGNSLLHHSLMIWGTDNGSGARHTVRDVPFILAGQAGGALRTGRTIHYPLDTTHNGLLISVANAFGEDVETFGNPLLCNGPLSGLF